MCGCYDVKLVEKKVNERVKRKKQLRVGEEKAISEGRKQKE